MCGGGGEGAGATHQVTGRPRRAWPPPCPSGPGTCQSDELLRPHPRHPADLWTKADCSGNGLMTNEKGVWAVGRGGPGSPFRSPGQRVWSRPARRQAVSSPWLCSALVCSLPQKQEAGAQKVPVDVPSGHLLPNEGTGRVLPVVPLVPGVQTVGPRLPGSGPRPFRSPRALLLVLLGLLSVPASQRVGGGV